MGVREGEGQTVRVMEVEFGSEVEVEVGIIL